MTARDAHVAHQLERHLASLTPERPHQEVVRALSNCFRALWAELGNIQGSHLVNAQRARHRDLSAVRRHLADGVLEPILVGHVQGAKRLVAHDVDEEAERCAVGVERLLIRFGGDES